MSTEGRDHCAHGTDIAQHCEWCWLEWSERREGPPVLGVAALLCLVTVLACAAVVSVHLGRMDASTAVLGVLGALGVTALILGRW